LDKTARSGCVLFATTRVPLDRLTYPFLVEHLNGS